MRIALLGLTGLTGLAAACLPLAALVISSVETLASHANGRAAAPGRSHDGLPLGRPSALQGGQLLAVQPAQAETGPAAQPAPATGPQAGLTLRQGCAWGQPGRMPYRGTTEQALTAARLPPEVVRQIAAQRQAGQKAGRLQISREAIRLADGSRNFNPRQMAMSFGHSLCLNSYVNFAPGHVEPADLYEARDDQGRLHSVMVPEVCGNVTVLAAGRPAGVVAGVAGALARRSLALTALADALVQDPGQAGPLLAAASPGGGISPGDAPGVAVGGGAGLRPGAGSADAGTVAGPLPQRSLLAGADGSSGSQGGPGGSGGDPGNSVGISSGTTGALSGGASGVTRSGGDSAGSGSTAAGLLPRQGPSTVGADLVPSWLPRSTLISSLNGSAWVLAQAGTTITSLSAPLGEQPAGGGQSVRQNTTDRRTVPEPGTLLCVLGGLAALAAVRRRG